MHVKHHEIIRSDRESDERSHVFALPERTGKAGQQDLARTGINLTKGEIMKKLGFIGMGNMASAILLGAVKSGFLKGEETIAYDPNDSKLNGLNRECGMAKATSIPDVINNSEMITSGGQAQKCRKHPE